MKNPNVAVIFGSRSAEHDVSIVTALASIIKPLELTKQYTVTPVYIAKDGKWYSDEKLKDIGLYTSGKIDDFLKTQKPVALQFAGGFRLLKPGVKNRVIDIDIVFPATHGTHGEDGELMAVLEMANVPYVGCGVPASVISMDKVLAKQTARAAGIATPKFCNFSRAEFNQDSQRCIGIIKQTLQYPLFVKPPHLGSSIGITQVAEPQALQNAIEVALHYDDHVLVEEGVSNLTEVTLPIMGNDELRPALLEEPLTKPEDFFDFETKYMQGGKKGKNGGKAGAQGYSRVPADLPNDLYDKAESTGLAVYRAIGCTGIARVDMLIDGKSGIVYFNEVNPLPGGLYSHNWNKAGLSNVELVTKLIALAQERHAKKQETETVFSTNYLKQF